MWLHACLFAVILIVFAGKKTGWLRLPEGIDERSFRLFVLSVLAGNLLGCCMSFMEERKPQENYTRLAREDSGSYRKELTVSMDGGSAQNIEIQIPAKERPASEENAGEDTGIRLETEKERLSREIEDNVVRYNLDKADPDYYYLPASIEGKSCTWGKPKDNRGQMIAGLCIAGGLMILMLGGRETERREQDKRERMLAEYPPMIMKFTLLIQAGMSVRRAFQKMGADYSGEIRKEEGKKRRLPGMKVRHQYAGEEILLVCHELDRGISEAEAYRHLGERCSSLCYRTFSILLVQNLQKGNRSLADLLEREAADAWEERKRKARVMGETASTKLLFPMLLMLLVVMAVIMVPAFLAF